MQPDVGPDLYAVTWRLTGIEDLTGQLDATPPGYQALRFRHTTLHRGNDAPGVPVTSAQVTGGIDTLVVVEREHMRFDEWTSNLVGSYSAAGRSPQPGVSDRPPSFEERTFVLSILTGTVHWSLAGNTLTLTKPGAGSLTYKAGHPV